MPPYMPIEQRLIKHSERRGECLIWTGSLNYSGYGRITIGGRTENAKTLGAYRVAYETWVGPIPEGMEIDHLCRNRACIEPTHLEAVTHAENVRRAEPAQRTSCIHGHEYTPENTIMRSKNGGQSRLCRTCTRQRRAEYRARRRERNAA